MRYKSFGTRKKYANMEIPIIHFDVVKKILVVSKTKGEKKNYCIQIRLHINFYLAKMFACSKKLVHFSSQHSFLDFFIVLCLTLLQQTSFTCLISFKSFSFFFCILIFCWIFAIFIIYHEIQVLDIFYSDFALLHMCSCCICCITATYILTFRLKYTVEYQQDKWTVSTATTNDAAWMYTMQTKNRKNGSITHKLVCHCILLL